VRVDIASFLEYRDNDVEDYMHNEFTAIFETDGEWVIAYCPEIPGANGQGYSREEARQDLADAIALILEDRREDTLRGLPADIEKEIVVVAA
jgi:predicted RNase H-like HicB family nuclease